MTLIVAIGCTDGVVLASESCSSDFVNRIKQPVTKVHQISGQPIVWGASGDGGLIGKIEEALAGYAMRASLKADRKDLKLRIATEQRDALAGWVPYPGTEAPSATVLIAGVRGGKPWILEIDRSGNDTSYGEAYGYFYAIGSAGSFAHASFRPHLQQPREVKAAHLHAFRILDDAINVAVFGLDRPLQIFTVKASGEVEQLDKDGLQRIGELCEGWRTLERETFGKILNPGLTTVPEIPTP